MDIKFFDKWSKKMSWILGWLYADGWLIKTGSFHLESKDKEIPKKLKQLLNVNNKIIIRKIKRGYSYRFSLSNKYLFNKLLKLGLTPKKSLTMKFPSVPKKYLQHFIRGYFEGDGCFVYVKNYYNDKYVGSLITSFTSGSYNFLEKLRKKLIKLNFKPNKIIKISKTNAYRLNIQGLDFPLWMYNNFDKLYLKRKYNKLMKIKNILKNKINIKKFHKNKHYSLKTEFKKGHIPWNKL